MNNSRVIKIRGSRRLCAIALAEISENFAADEWKEAVADDVFGFLDFHLAYGAADHQADVLQPMAEAM